MTTNAFIGKKKSPTEVELAAELGKAKKLWDQLLEELSSDYGLEEQEWNSYSPKAGWALRVKAAKRNIVYLSPCREEFLASFALGDRAMEVVRKSTFPDSFVRITKEAKKYAEGTAVRLPVKKAGDLEIVKRLVAIKLEN